MEVQGTSSSVHLSTETKAVLAASGLAFILFVIVILNYIIKISVGVVFSLSKRSAKLKGKDNGVHHVEAKPEVESTLDQRNRGPDLKQLIKEQKASKKGVPKDEQAPHHSLFLNTLKGHGDVVTGFAWSSDGKQLATACEDMLIRVFDVSDISNRDPKFRRIKTSKPPLGVGFGDAPDSVVAILKGIPDAILASYSRSQGKNGDAATYDVAWQVANVHGKDMSIALRCANRRFAGGRPGIIVSLSSKKDVKVFDMQGREIGTLDIASLANHDLAVSVDGRFIAVASFTADVKIWEVKIGKEGEGIKGVVRAMELKGHKSKVMAVSFSPNNKRCVTCSQDGTLRVWNIDVRYTLEEDPKTILVIPISLSGNRIYTKLAYGPSDIIAAACEGVIHLISAAKGEMIDVLEAHDGPITQMSWSPVVLNTPNGQRSVLATASRDKRVRLWTEP